MFAQKRPYTCLVYPQLHPSFFPPLQPEQRAFLNQWRHLLDRPPPSTSEDGDLSAPIPSSAADVDQSAATISAVGPAASLIASSSLSSPPTDTTASAAAPSPSTASVASSPLPYPEPSLPCPVSSVDELSALWLSLAADVSLPVGDAITLFGSHLSSLLLHLHSSHTSDACLCLPSVLAGLSRTVLRTRTQLKPKRNQATQPPNPSSPLPPLDRHIQLQILLRLALPALPAPGVAATAAAGCGAAGGYVCDSDELVGLFELLQSVVDSEREVVGFVRCVVVPLFGGVQREVIKAVCREMDWALPLELRSPEQMLEEEQEWEESDDENDQGSQRQLHPVQLTRSEVLPAATQHLPSRTQSSASATTAPTTSLPHTATFQPIRRTSLPHTQSAAPIYPPTPRPPPPSTTAPTHSAALSQLRQQRLLDQLRRHEHYAAKRKRAREGLTEDEERARAVRAEREEAARRAEVRIVSSVFAAGKKRITTRVPAAAVTKRESGCEAKQKKDEDEAVAKKRKGVRQLDFAARGKDDLIAPVAVSSGGGEFVAETPMTKGVRGRTRSGGSSRSPASNGLQRPAGRPKRSLTSLLEQQAVQ